MKKTIFLTILILSTILLIACERNDTSDSGNVIADQLIVPRPVPRAQNTQEPHNRLRIQIAISDENILDRFDRIHKFDYNTMRVTRDGKSIDALDGDGTSIVIWADEKITDFEVISLGNVSMFNMPGGQIPIPIDSFITIDELSANDAFVITDYVGIGREQWVDAGRTPWSGITFWDESGARRYFAIVENAARSHLNTGWSLREFENLTDEFPADFRPWWRNELTMSTTEQSPVVHSSERLATLREQAGISEYGLKVAAEFLNNFDSIFEGVFSAEYQFDEDRREQVATGRYWRNNAMTRQRHSSMTNQRVIADDLPMFFLRSERHGDYDLFDRQGNAILDAPWINHRQRGGSDSIYYANYFRLFNFGNNGIPDIIVHFQQTVESCYDGFSEIFRYIDGEFRRLNMVGYNMSGEPLSVEFLGTYHIFFTDTDGRIIAFVDYGMNELTGEYTTLTFTNSSVELHQIATGRSIYDSWHEHHWEAWGSTHNRTVRIDSWIYHNPTVFETDIRITPHSLDELNLALYAYLLHTRQQ